MIRTKNVGFRRLLVLASIVPLLCSMNRDRGTIEVEYHAFTSARVILDSNGNNVESQNLSAPGVGHVYFIVRNNTQQAITVGYHTVSPYTNVSIGLWTSSAIGSSSTSLSNFNIVSSSSSCPSFTQGVLYDYESVFYNVYERATDERYLIRTISNSTLAQLSQTIINKNDTYNAIAYNCATFATELWNIVDGTNYWTGWFRTPTNVLHEIGQDYGSEYLTGSGSLTIKNSFVRHHNATEWSIYSRQ